MPPTEIVSSWLAALGHPATYEQVREGFWYVRVNGINRQWIPIEISLGERTVLLVSHVIPDPIDNAESVYKYLLRKNFHVTDCAFAFEGREGVICLVSRIDIDALTSDELDRRVGSIVQLTEETFRVILSIGFESVLKSRKS